MADLCIPCPHCGDSILIKETEINCGIFRHGVLKISYAQMNPHETKEICDKLYANGEIFGCGKPFCLKQKASVYCAEECDYI